MGAKMEKTDKYLKTIEKELKSLEKSKRNSIINELKDHINERMDEEERQSLDKIIEIIGKPKDVAKGYLNICEEPHITQKTWIIAVSIIVSIILLILGIYYLLILVDALSKNNLEYTKYLLFIPFILLAISTELISLTIIQKSSKYFKKFKPIFLTYLFVGIILIGVAFFPFIEKYDLTTSLSFPDASQPNIKIDHENNVHIIWINSIQKGRLRERSIHYSKINKNGEKIVDDLFIGLCSLYYQFDIDNIGNVHLIYREEVQQTGNTYSIFLKYVKIDSLGKIIRELIISEDFDFSEDCFSLALDSKNNLHLVYLEEHMRLGRDKIRYPILTYANINDKGSIKYKNISKDCPDSPKIAIDTNDNIYIVWKDAKNWHENNSAGTLNYDVYLTKIINNKIVVNKTKLSDKPHELYFPKIFNIDDNVIILWDDYENIYWEIFDNKSRGLISFSSLNIKKSGSYSGSNQYKTMMDTNKKIYFDKNSNFYLEKYINKKYGYIFIQKNDFLDNNNISAETNLRYDLLNAFSYSQYLDFDSENNIHIVYIKKVEHEKYESRDILYTSGNSTIQINPLIEFKDDKNEVKNTGLLIILITLIPIIISFMGVKKSRK